MRPSNKSKKYRSGFEEGIASVLTLLKINFKYEPEDGKIKYTKPATKHTYTPDFILPNGIIVEAKGYLDLADRKKMLLVIKQHPDKDIRMLFQRPHTPINKGSKTTYADWCVKSGIKFGTKADLPSWASE